ncbi:MAG: hypothetical protein ACYTHK_13020 [Planctomycetota bacterium]
MGETKRKRRKRRGLSLLELVLSCSNPAVAIGGEEENEKEVPRKRK